MAATTVLFLLLILLCLAAEGFFSGSEIAFISLNRLRVKRLADAGNRNAVLIQKLLSRPERLLSTALLGTNIAVVCNAYCANELFLRLVGPDLSSLSILVMIPVVLVFGEVLPKSFFLRRADTIAPTIIRPFTVAAVLFRAPAALLGLLSRAVQRIAGIEDRETGALTREVLVHLTSRELHIFKGRETRRIVRSLFDLPNLRVREIMIPLVDVEALSTRATVQQALDRMLQAGFSQIPVYRDRIDNIIGLVFLKDLLSARGPEESLRNYTAAPLYLPEMARLDYALSECQRRGTKAAIVVDEYGAAEGIVTVSDILEEVVGELLDEFTKPEKPAVRAIGPGAFEVDGRARLSDLDPALRAALPESGASTLNGLLVEKAERVPSPGEEIAFDRAVVRVLEATSKRVARVQIALRQDAGRGE